MPAVIILEVVADNADFGLFVQRPVVGSGRLAVERELSGGNDIDEIVGDRSALLSVRKSPLRKVPPRTIR